MPPNQALHLTRAALLVSRDTTLMQRPRQVSLVVMRQPQEYRHRDIASLHQL